MAASPPAASPPGTLSLLIETTADYSYLQRLTPDPDQAKHTPNKTSRQVTSGHYVLVAPSPLPKPLYVAHSTLAATLGITNEEARSDKFVRFFSGDMDAVSSVKNARSTGWATPYALSIYGSEMLSNCPFKNGNGYGDGRAISVLEVVKDSIRYEMQLKGAGTTPFCRGGDGRAVLRSSVREYLVSEAMHNLGVSSCRTLSLIVSQSETVNRPWYSEGSAYEEPDTMVTEFVAISTRVAASFLRVGQLELYGRRCRKNEPAANEQLVAMIDHIIFREYPTVASTLLLEDKIMQLGQEFAARLSQLVADWVRVGFCQGNFNSDNCAVGGRTLDYGPFGFVEQFEAGFQRWTGGGGKFSLMNQPSAAAMNYKMYCVAVAPLLSDGGKVRLNQLMQSFVELANDKMQSMFAKKVGLKEFDAAIVPPLLNLLEDTRADYTLFFRELSSLPNDVGILRARGVFYPPEKGSSSTAADKLWNDWLALWHTALRKEGRPPADVTKEMKTTNPKYIPREWMLVQAYQAAAKNNFSLVHELQAVFLDPFGEQGAEIEAKYYKKASNAALVAGGVAHMT